jgi:hypothetical protein
MVTCELVPERCVGTPLAGLPDQPLSDYDAALGDGIPPLTAAAGNAADDAYVNRRRRAGS